MALSRCSDEREEAARDVTSKRNPALKPGQERKRKEKKRKEKKRKEIKERKGKERKDKETEEREGESHSAGPNSTICTPDQRPDS